MYAIDLVKIELLWLGFYDAIREGDGDCIFLGTFVIKLFKSNIMFYYAGILTVTLQASLSL